MTSCARRTRTPEGRRKRMVVCCSALDKPHGPIVFWLRKLGPFRTTSERTFEHCVSPSPAATITTGPCIHRKSRRRHHPHPYGSKRELAWKCSPKRALGGRSALPPERH